MEIDSQKIIPKYSKSAQMANNLGRCKPKLYSQLSFERSARLELGGLQGDRASKSQSNRGCALFIHHENMAHCAIFAKI